MREWKTKTKGKEVVMLSARGYGRLEIKEGMHKSSKQDLSSPIIGGE